MPTPTRSTRVIVGLLAGIPLGLGLVAALIGAYFFQSVFGLRTVIGTAIVLPAALLLTGLVLAVRGRPAFGTFLMVGGGIVAIGLLGIVLLLLLLGVALLTSH